MKRTIAVVGVLSVLAVVLVSTVDLAEAADTTHTVHADFAAGNAVYDNMVSVNNDLRVDSIDNVTGDWYRGHYNGTDYQIDVAKDTVGALWAADPCLPTGSNPWSNSERFTIAASGYIYRTGMAASGVNEVGLVNGKLFPPVNPMQADSIRFITHGAKVAHSSYVVTVNRSTGDDLIYTVPILAANVAVRDGTGVGFPVGASWTRTAIPNFDVGAGPGCLGDGGDEVVMSLPNGTEIVSITISYPTKNDPGLDGEWLGGPIAMSVTTVESEIDRAFDWSGTYQSSNQVATAVGPPSGLSSRWHEADRTGEAFGAFSEGELFVRCGDDSNGNGTIAGGEWKNYDGGQSGADVWQGPIALRGSSPVNIVDCTGRYLQYRIELLPEFDTSPRINEITFSYNPDADGDGYFAESVTGHGQVDCGDNDAALNHDDVDGDSYSTCQGDCNDDSAEQYPTAGVQPNHIGDGIDRDCNGFDECWRNVDGDLFGIELIIDESSDNGTTCEPADGEAVTQPGGFDCDDTDPAVNPAATDVPYNGIDDDCSDGDEIDVDGDGYTAYQATGGVPDCDDTDPAVNPGVVGDRNNCRNPTGVDDTATTSRDVPVTIDVLANDTDPTNDPLDIAAGTVSNPPHGTAVIVGARIVYSPDSGFVGVDSFTYRPSDGTHVAADAAVVSVTVSGGPVAMCAGKLVTIDMNINGGNGTGTAGDDVILGTPNADVIDAGAGSDTVCGEGGDDTIDGGVGDFRDFLYGGPGDDTLFGGFGIDYMYGEAGEDTLDGQGGSDRLFGGPGNDLIKGDSGADRMYGGPGDDEMRGMGGQDFMWGEAGDDLMQGNFQTDNMWGGPGNDTMFGAGGKDSLFGEAGNDALSGGNNTDYLDGGADVDTANGGRGRDKPLIAPQTRASNGQLFGGSGCIAETIVNCQPNP